MQENPSTSHVPVETDADVDSKAQAVSEKSKRSWSQVWEGLIRLGLGELTLRVGTGVVSIALVLLVVWVMTNFYLKGQVNGYEPAQAAALTTPTPELVVPQLKIPTGSSAVEGVTRIQQVHTILPTRPRFDVVQYEVQDGDTIFAIAQKFNLKPETILWGNYYVLADDPHRLRPGQKLNILPVDGVYYEWHTGDGLNGVAEFYKAKADDIVSWPGNNLDPNTLGDWSAPNIKAGTWLVIPNGWREFVTWSAPRITRSNPSVAKILGPGACGQVNDGPIGTGAFVWPSTEKYVSGYDYSPETNHYGIDIAGKLGNPIFAVDNGVVVYAGWNDWGYGNVIVVDHGNGWQSLYAHLSSLSVGCGSYVYSGGTIGLMGSTGNSSGPHLHFELRSDTYGRPNPWDFLQK